jgi:hypothetical protein
VRIVDQALPAHGGARLSKYTHHHQQVVLQALGLDLQAAGVFHRRGVVVDRARADHHQQAVVGAKQDAVDRRARLESGRRGLGRCRKLAQHMGGRGELLDGLDTDVVDVDFRGGVHGESCRLA